VATDWPSFGERLAPLVAGRRHTRCQIGGPLLDVSQLDRLDACEPSELLVEVDDHDEVPAKTTTVAAISGTL